MLMGQLIRLRITLILELGQNTAVSTMAVGRGIGALDLFLAISLIGASQAYLKAGCKIDTLRACGSDYVPYGKGPHLHESGEEFEEGCKRDRIQLPCTLQFIKNCTEGLARATALVAVQALEENIEAICVVGSEAYKNYQRGIKCMNSHGDKMHKCLGGFHDILEQAVIKGPTKEVIPHTCCSYHDLLAASPRHSRRATASAPRT
ncbi:uncharacterized protein LOC125946800 [Dermacentor silvarum]|uniref:uncharacterized protein LOC125946800 n=1 Tax=Dermacentor silvarum TaxID=543639 RepID=UPI002100F67D|nr:uncharacterized protein LOC125946800 [Dermacentor silvarum]